MCSTRGVSGGKRRTPIKNYPSAGFGTVSLYLEFISRRQNDPSSFSTVSDSKDSDLNSSPILVECLFLGVFGLIPKRNQGLI